jgi:hypothetical protein
MALDDRGNPQIDFVWGNFPMQPNYDYDTETYIRQGQYYAPGNGEAEYYYDGHATAAEWGDTAYFPADYLKPSAYLDGKDSHNIYLRQWNAFPTSNPDTGFNLTVNWWEVTPAMEMPNLYGKTVEEAFASLRNCGVAENFLQDRLSDAENPYNSGTWLKDSGILIWRYLDPNYVIGTHWDGSDWLASEVNGKITEMSSYPREMTAIGSYNEDGVTTSDPTDPTMYEPGWLTIVAVQTTDPDKNSWNWWN